MHDIMNETQLWYCGICDETIDKNSQSKHVNSKTQIHKKGYVILVEESDSIRPESEEVSYKLNDSIEDCTTKFFH